PGLAVVGNEVTLPRCPLVPALEGDLKVVAQGTRDCLRLRASEHRPVNRHRLPAAEPRPKSGHAGKLGQLVKRGPLIDGPGGTVGPQLRQLERAQPFRCAERDRPPGGTRALTRRDHGVSPTPLPKPKTTPRPTPARTDS